MYCVSYSSVLIIVVLFCGVAESWFFGGNSFRKGSDWNKLSVTWGYFSGLPKEESQAKNEKWTKTDSCDVNSYFRGNRYVLENDKSVMLLFDSNGKIAGTQFGIKKSIAVNPGYQKKHWIPDGDSYVITAYFVHPSVICNGKRKPSEYIGENLFIQVGPSISELMEIPLEEKDLEKLPVPQRKWVKGKCFYSMGQHYWFNITKEMNCKDFFPVFLLYSSSKLTGFGWAAQGNVQSSRVEHPTSSTFHLFFQQETQPTCLNNQGILSTEHVYLQRYPYLNRC